MAYGPLLPKGVIADLIRNLLGQSEPLAMSH